MITRKQKQYVRSFLRLEGDIRKLSNAKEALLWTDNTELRLLLNRAQVKMRETLDTHPLAKFLDQNVKESDKVG